MRADPESAARYLISPPSGRHGTRMRCGPASRRVRSRSSRPTIARSSRGREAELAPVVRPHLERGPRDRDAPSRRVRRGRRRRADDLGRNGRRALDDAGAHLRVSRRKGALSVGLDADIVLFDPAARTTIRGTDLHHSSDYTPFEGREVRGAVRSTIVRGAFVVRDGTFVGRRGYGRFVERAIEPLV